MAKLGEDSGDHGEDLPGAVVDCALYEDGGGVPGRVGLERILYRIGPEAERFAWIGLYEPTAEQLQRVADAFDLHPLAVEVHAHQRPWMSCAAGRKPTLTSSATGRRQSCTPSRPWSSTTVLSAGITAYPSWVSSAPPSTVPCAATDGSDQPPPARRPKPAACPGVPFACPRVGRAHTQ